MYFNQHNGLQVKNNSTGHVWCGPAALAAAIGSTTTMADNIFKHTTLRNRIKGVSYKEMEHALAFRHIRFKSTRYPRRAADCLTLARWLKSRQAQDEMKCTYLVCITGHWVTIRGNHWVCNMNQQGRLLENIPYGKAKVRYVIQLLEDQ